MKSCLTLLMLIGLAGAVGGCETLSIYPPDQRNFYRGPDGDLRRLRRVCFVQLSEDTGYPDIARRMSHSLRQELQAMGMFHVDLITADQHELRDWDPAQRGPYTIKELASIRRDLGCDAVLFGQVTSFKPYPSTQIGLYLRLIDLKDGRLVWAVDDTWDTTERATVARIRRYFFREMRETYQPVGDELAVMGTDAFQKFVSAEVVETLDSRSGQESMPRKFFRSPTGIDLRRLGRTASRVARDTAQDF